MQNAKFSFVFSHKSNVIELFLCDARRQIRSIVDLCEEFGVRHTRAKRANQNDFYFTKSSNAAAHAFGSSIKPM